ncbi:uncharacterized protein VP01_10215g1, partial [Puccinia sorghi]
TLKAPSNSGPKFCTPGMKPPDKFNSENFSKLQGFLQSCKLLFSNDPTVFSGSQEDPLCGLVLRRIGITLFGDPNEVRNAEFELNSLSMKDNGKASTYISQVPDSSMKGQLEQCRLCFPFSKRASESHHRPALSDWPATENASTVDRSNHRTQQLLS